MRGRCRGSGSQLILQVFKCNACSTSYGTPMILLSRNFNPWKVCGSRLILWMDSISKGSKLTAGCYREVNIGSYVLLVRHYSSTLSTCLLWCKETLPRFVHSHFSSSANRWNQYWNIGTRHGGTVSRQVVFWYSDHKRKLYAHTGVLECYIFHCSIIEMYAFSGNRSLAGILGSTCSRSINLAGIKSSRSSKIMSDF